MFPLRDHNPSEITPVVTWALITVNVVLFLMTLGIYGDERALLAFYSTWGIVPARLTNGGDWLPLLTSMFVHGGFMHLGGNMLFLWIFGDNLEEAMGRLRFLGFYLVSGLGAGLLQVAAAPDSTVPVVGASGAIAGVMGGYLLLFPRARIDILVILVFIIRVIPVPAFTMLGFWFAVQLISGMASDAGGGGIAFWAHAGGFAVGLVLAIPVWLVRGGAAGWRASHGRPPHPEARYRLVPSNIPKVPRRSRRRGPWGR